MFIGEWFLSIYVFVLIRIWFVCKPVANQSTYNFSGFLDVKERVIHIVIEFHLFAIALSATVNTCLPCEGCFLMNNSFSGSTLEEVLHFCNYSFPKQMENF